MNALERLLEQSRRLPGPGPSLDLPRALDGGDERLAGERPAPSELRRRVAALLRALADRVDAELSRAQELARTAWDQVDAITLVDSDSWDEARKLRAGARLGTGDDDAGVRAHSLAAALTLDAAVGLALLVEHRFATLVRLSAVPEGENEREPALLELGAALAEAARAWA